MNKLPTSTCPRPTASLRRCAIAVFRRIWIAGLLSNLGLLIQGVGAAWQMTLMTSSADMVALVQTAALLPTLLISIAAGAIADMHDRRIVALVGAVDLAHRRRGARRCWPISAGCRLTSCSASRFLIGTGMALFQPAWQASVNEQVPPETLPQAVALNGISLQHRAQLWPGHRRRDRRGRGRGGVVRRQRPALHAADRRAAAVEARDRAGAPAAGAAHPRHRLRRALRHPFAAPAHRADAHAAVRRDRQRDAGADAAARARPARRRRQPLRHHARRVRPRRRDRRAERLDGAAEVRSRTLGARLLASSWAWRSPSQR